tara:strand:- start:31066 stop:32502 length:1437 start_codon:yes stop_codon:yes gene_type:complete
MSIVWFVRDYNVWFVRTEMEIGKSNQNLLKKCSEYFNQGKVISLGTGLPSLLPFVLNGSHDSIFLSSSGLVGDWRASTATTKYIDSNGQYVTLMPGSSIVGIGEKASIISGGYVDTILIQPTEVDLQGNWDIDGPDTSEIDSLVTNCSQVIGLVPLNGLQKFTYQLDPSRGFERLSKIITERCVFGVDGGKLVVEELANGTTSDDIMNAIGINVPISPNCQYYDVYKVGTSSADMIGSKVCKDGASAVVDIQDGAVVMIDGFAGPGGMAHYLLVSLRNQGAKNLTIISNTAGIARVVNFGTPPGKLVIDHSILIDNGQVGKAIASYPVSPSASNPSSFELAYRAGEVDLELVPQGTLAERLRAGGSGVKYFYTPTGAGTLIAEGKDSKSFEGKNHIRESGLVADYCIIRGYKADRFGNVVYKGTSRNFNAVMAPAARISIVEVDEIVEDDALDPELIVTPGLFVDRIVVRPAEFSPYE